MGGVDVGYVWIGDDEVVGVWGGGVSESRGEWLGMWVRDGDGVFVGVFLCVRTYIYDPALRDV